MACKRTFEIPCWRSFLVSRASRTVPLSSLRRYATQSSTGSIPIKSRKQVTVVNDDGRVQWTDLSNGEKAARATQQTFNFGLVLTGLAMTGGVAYFLYSEVFSSDSKTSHFNRAVDQVRSDPRAKELLGPGKQIRAFGEPTWNKWARSRPIASTIRKDGSGNEHLLMHFNVEGPQNSGVVNLHMTKKRSQSEYKYKYLALDVKGHSRIYLENVDEASETKKPGMKMFGVTWR